MIKTFKIYTLGCKVNHYDSGRLAALLSARGLVELDDWADLVIINTCSVTKATGSKNSRTLAMAKQRHPEAKLAVVGCWTRIYPEDKRNFESATIINAKEPEAIVLALDKALTLPSAVADPEVLIQQDRARYFIKVQDGCRQFCAYCVIPYSRGTLWSRPLDEVVTEAKAAEAKGYQELVLTGIHLGLYGQPEGENDLVDLLKALLEACPKLRFRLSSIEPMEVTDKLIDLMAEQPRLCRHLHISLQSGCDNQLKTMNRPYTSEQFANRLANLRRHLPDIAITTDVIVGFPGETEIDFQASLDFVRQMAFAKVHVFAFSAHPKAAASNFPDQVPVDIIKERAAVMRGLSHWLETEYLQTWAKAPFEVLVLGRRDGKWLGKDNRFFNVAFNSPEFEPQRGQLLTLNNGEVVGLDD